MSYQHCLKQTLLLTISITTFLNKFVGPQNQRCCWQRYAFNELGSSLFTYRKHNQIFSHVKKPKMYSVWTGNYHLEASNINKFPSHKPGPDCKIHVLWSGPIVPTSTLVYCSNSPHSSTSWDYYDWFCSSCVLID